MLTRWAKGLCFTKCCDGRNVFTLQGYRLVVTVCVGKSTCDQSDHLIGFVDSFTYRKTIKKIRKLLIYVLERFSQAVGMKDLLLSNLVTVRYGLHFGA